MTSRQESWILDLIGKKERDGKRKKKGKNYEIHIFFNGIFFLLWLKIQVLRNLGNKCFHSFLFQMVSWMSFQGFVSEIKSSEWEVWQDWEQCCPIAEQRGTVRKVRSHIKGSYAEDVGKGAFKDCWRESKLVQALEKWAWRFLDRTKNGSVLCDQAIPFLIRHLRTSKLAHCRGACPSVFTITLFIIIAKWWNQPRKWPIDEWIKKIQYIHTMKNYSVVKKNKIMCHWQKDGPN